MNTENITLTKEEFLERYGNILVKFESYYKYEFVFSAKLADNTKIEIIVGGTPEKIYKFTVNASDEVCIISLDFTAARIYYEQREIISYVKILP